MRATTFDDLMRHERTATTADGAVPLKTLGASIQPSEVSSRLAPGLYSQLSLGDDTTVTRAAERAALQVSAVASGLGKTLNLDDAIMREIVLLMTIYELHMAVGHEAAGKEYRLRAKDLMVSAFGKFPEADDPNARPAIGAITVSSPDRATRRHHRGDL
jgi:hypothetical protein